jgi:hypothetical protein
MRGMGPWMAATLLIAAAGTAAPAVEYVVQQDDTLVRIARSRMGDDARWKELAQANGLRPPYALHVGQRLVLPAGWPATAPAGATTRPTGARGGLAAENPDGSPPAPLPPARALRTTRRGLHPPTAGAALPASRPGAPGRPVPATRPAVWGEPQFRAFLAAFGAVAIGLIFALGALLWWVFFSLCLRGACWFALVQATMGACFRLGLYLILLGAACTGLGMLLPVLASEGAGVPAMFALGAMAVLAFFAVSLYLTRRVLGCQWRSVVTVLVMATFVSDLLAAAIAVTGIVLAGTMAVAR